MKPAEVKEFSIVPAPFRGLWQREFIRLGDGTEDRTTRVFWAQTSSWFIDLRVPNNRAPHLVKSGFGDLTLDDCLTLAAQKGFAGRLSVKGSRCTWHRLLDYRPPTGRSDTGEVVVRGDTLRERGDASAVLATDYEELYIRRVSVDKGCVALALKEGGSSWCGNGPAVLILLGDKFLFARGRPEPLSQAESLADLVRAAWPDRRRIAQLLDCEVSMGDIGPGEWRVTLSTVPRREQQRLMPRVTPTHTKERNELILDTDQGQTIWDIAEAEPSALELEELFS